MADGFAQKVVLAVRVSGRLIIAQQFTAGRRSERPQSVERTAEVISLGYLLFFSRPLHGLDLTFVAVPSDKSLGYFQSSANADWGSVLFVQSHGGRREAGNNKIEQPQSPN
jgi:hypothetical protein